MRFPRPPLAAPYLGGKEATEEAASSLPQALTERRAYMPMRGDTPLNAPGHAGDSPDNAGRAEIRVPLPPHPSAPQLQGGRV
jgi:hypothetical protein